MKHLATVVAAIATGAILACGVAPADEPRAPVAHPLKKMSLKQCNKLADDRKLSGKGRNDYIKDCRSKNAPLPAVTAPATH